MAREPVNEPSRTRTRPLLIAAVLVVASGALQLAASLQRWVLERSTWSRTDISVEDHRFDYAIPSDPWENLAQTAQLYGLGMLALAAGVWMLALAAGRRAEALAGPAIVTAAIAAGATAILGLHALLSGVLGVPSPLGFGPIAMIVSLAQLAALLMLAGIMVRLGRLWAGGALMLLWVTIPGQLLAYVAAPTFAGYTSHDTTPWTETIVAVATVIAGLLLLGAWARERVRVATPAPSTPAR